MQKTDTYAQKLVFAESLIAAEHYYSVPDSTCTICAMVLKSGFTVTGTSYCSSFAEFNAAKGRAIARENAIAEVIYVESYLRNSDGAGSTNALRPVQVADNGAEPYAKVIQDQPHGPVSERVNGFTRLISAIRSEFTEEEIRQRIFEESVWQVMQIICGPAQAAQIIRWAQVEG